MKKPKAELDRTLVRTVIVDEDGSERILQPCVERYLTRNGIFNRLARAAGRSMRLEVRELPPELVKALTTLPPAKRPAGRRRKPAGGAA